MSEETIGDKIKKYTAKVKELEAERTHCQGKFDAGLEGLKTKYGVDTLEEAIDLQLTKTKEAEKLKVDLDKNMEEFEGLYSELLN